MDLIQPGIHTKVLRQVRVTNSCSARLLTQFQNLNEETNFYLLTLLDAKEVVPNSVEDVFGEFYYAVGASSSKKAKLPEISLSKLRTYFLKLDAAGPQDEAQKTLAAIMEKYAVVITLHHLANSLIYKTVLVKLQLSYWLDIRYLTYLKLLYGVQTLPIRVFNVARAGVASTSVLSTSSVSRKLAALWASIRRILASTFSSITNNFVLKSSRWRYLQVPLGFIDEEAKHKIDLIEGRLDVLYRQLGVIINNLPAEKDVFAKVIDINGLQNANMAETISEVDKYIRDNSADSVTAKPSFFIRYWPVLALLINFGPSTIKTTWVNRREIMQWLRTNVVDTFAGFWRNWIVKPVWEMLAILRQDDTMTITSKESLRLDLDSLERMVQDFMKDNNIQFDPQEVKSAVSQGDLTMMMSQYENEIKLPYKLIIKGSLVRLILIQVQKTKVDGGIAINGIDKLLKLQQLLFGALLILPSLFILYQANKALTSDASLLPSVASRRVDCLKSMNEIEKLVGGETRDDKLVKDGKLFVEIVTLTLLSRDLIPPKLRPDFLHDLNTLTLLSSEGHEDVANSVRRMWNMYAPFFRRLK